MKVSFDFSPGLELPLKFSIGVAKMDRRCAYWIHLVEEFRAVWADNTIWMLEHIGQDDKDYADFILASA